MKRWIPVLLALCALPSVLAAQQAAPWPPARPFPNPVEVPRGFERALQRGTRQANGMPGPRYWQQWADYRIHTRIDPAAKMVTGGETIVYHNRSPDTLAVLNVQLLQNLHAPEAVRDEPNEVTGGAGVSTAAGAAWAGTDSAKRVLDD